MTQELTTHEIKALRILDSYHFAENVSGAWFNACCERLKSLGYVSGVPYVLTVKGHELLLSLIHKNEPEIKRYSASSIMWGMDSKDGAKPNKDGEYIRYVQHLAAVALKDYIIAKQQKLLSAAVENQDTDLGITWKLVAMTINEECTKRGEKIAVLEAQLAAAKADNSKLRKLISSMHKRAVKHENCNNLNCYICDGGLFVCADCGAAEIETEERLCVGEDTKSDR